MRTFDQTSKGKKLKDKKGVIVDQSSSKPATWQENKDDEEEAKAVKNARDALKNRFNKPNSSGNNPKVVKQDSTT